MAADTQPTHPPRSGGVPSKPSTNGGKKPPKAGRDADGKYAPGNFGGPGNPYARQVAKLKNAFIEETTTDHMRVIARKMIELAENGNVSAARLVCSYSMGKPTAGVNPDQVDIDEHQRVAESAHIWGTYQPLVDMAEPSMALAVMRWGRETATARLEKMTRGTLSLSKKEWDKLDQLPWDKRKPKLLAAGEKAQRELDRRTELGGPEPPPPDLAPPDLDPFSTKNVRLVDTPPSPNGGKRRK